MTINNLRESAEFAKTIAAPICIVGGGIAGLLLARRIASGGGRVVVVESGVDAFDETIHALNEIDDPAGRYSRALTGRYRGLGGTSSRWGGRMIPMNGHDTGERMHVSQPAWPFPTAQLDSYHREIEEIFGVGPGSHESIAGEGDGAAGAFLSSEATLTPRWAKCPSFKHCNVATLLRDELKGMRNVDIWLGATVCEFELDRDAGRLSAVVARDFSGKRLAVRADRFIFAAGTIETTRLLLLLDAASQGRAFGRCEALGRYFQDHLKAEVATIDRRDPVATNRLFAYRFVNSTRRDLHLELSHKPQREDAVGSAFVYVAMDIAQSPLASLKRIAHGLQRRQVDLRDLGALLASPGLIARAGYWRSMRNQLFVPADVDFRLLICVEQLPQRSNRISLSPACDALGVARARLEWAPTQMDEKTFRSALAALESYWRETGFDRLCPLRWMPVASDAAGSIIEQAEACAHPSGSTRMGMNPVESVVGPDLFCHDVPNVAVVSASVFPTAGSANPTFTIMKLAMWMADACLQPARGRRPAPVPATGEGGLGMVD